MHQVFLGTDAANLPKIATTNAATYETDLGLGQTYYWKVVEVNEAKTPSTWESPVWSFTTAKSVAVEDFERYNDREGQGTRIYETWIDGFGTQTNGAQVGYLQAPFAEQTVFFGGKQSLPLTYSNTAGAAYSEAERTFDTPQNWTQYGCQGLSLHFFGDPNNSGQLYLKINGVKVLYSGAAADLKIAAWLPWTVDLAAAGVSAQKVTKLAIGVEGAGSAGKLYVDEIALYPGVARVVTPVDPGTTGLVAYYKLDGDAKDSAGTHHGTLAGNPQPFVTGKLGQAFNVTADLTHITVPYSADFAMSTFTVAAWVKIADKAGNRGILGTRFNGEYTFDLKVDAVRIHGDIGNGTAWLNSSTDVVAAQGGSLESGRLASHCLRDRRRHRHRPALPGRRPGGDRDLQRHAGVHEGRRGAAHRHLLRHNRVHARRDRRRADLQHGPLRGPDRVPRRTPGPRVHGPVRTKCDGPRAARPPAPIAVVQEGIERFGGCRVSAGRHPPLYYRAAPAPRPQRTSGRVDAGRLSTPRRHASTPSARHAYARCRRHGRPAVIDTCSSELMRRPGRTSAASSKMPTRFWPGRFGKRRAPASSQTMSSPLIQTPNHANSGRRAKSPSAAQAAKLRIFLN